MRPSPLAPSTPSRPKSHPPLAPHAPQAERLAHITVGVFGMRNASHFDGEAEGPYSRYPFLALVLHINREAIHHGAEVLLLRDLYRSRPISPTGPTRAPLAG